VVPVRRPAVSEQTILAEDGRQQFVVLKNAGTGVLFDPSPQELTVWRLLDGKRTLREVLGAALLEPEPVGPEQVGQAMLRFSRGGLLVTSFLAEPPPRRLAVERRLPVLTDNLRRIAGWTVSLLLVLPFVGLVDFLVQLRQTGLAVVPSGAEPWTVLLVVWGIVWIRGFSQMLTVLGFGFGEASAGVDCSAVLPLPRLDLSRLDLASRRQQQFISLAGLVSPISAACALCAWNSWTGGLELLAAQGAAVGLLLAVMDASPLFEWNGYRLYRAAFDQELVRDRALAFVARRLLVRAMDREELSREEKRLALYGIAVLAWVVGMLKLAAVALHASAVPVVMAVFRSGSLPVQTLMLFLLLACGCLLAVLLVRVLLTPVWLLGESARQDMLTRLTVPAAVLASAAGLLWESGIGQLLLHLLCASLVLWSWISYRSIFKGTRVMLAFDFLAFYVCSSVVLVVPAALFEQLSPMLGLNLSAGQPGLANSLGILLCFAVPLFLAHGLRVGLTRREMLVTVSSAGVLALPALQAWGMGAETGRLLDYAGIVATAVSLIPLLLIDRGSPIGRIWRLLFVGFVGLSAAATLRMLGSPGSDVYLATLPLSTAGFLPIAAALFVGARALRGPYRTRRRLVRTAPADLDEALRSASGILFGTLTDVAAQALGPRRSAAVLRESLWEAPDNDETGVRHGFTLRATALEAHGGHSFRTAALRAATTGLYWLEWEAAHRQILSDPGTAWEAEDIVSILADIPLFARLSLEERQRIATILRREQHLAHELVLEQGTPGDRFYLVHRGELDVFRASAGGRETPLGRLAPGDCFGELALIEPEGLRTASVRARCDTELLSMARDDFLETFSESAHERTMVISVIRHGGFLRRIPLLACLPSAMLWRLAARLVLRTCATGETLRSGAEDPARLFLVRTGRLQAEEPPGTAVEIGAGGVWGERQLASRTASAAVVRAIEPGEVLVLEMKDFEQELELCLAGIRTAEELSRRGGLA
jgi:CRP-like cAMP-binding protein